MKRFKTKLVALLATVGCFLACVGVGVATVDTLQETNVTASAATTYTVNTLTYKSGSATLIEAYPNDGNGKPSGNWNDKYTFVADTGTGFLFNGVAYEGWSIKQPGDFYIELGRTAVAGDVLTIDGSFYNANTGTTFVFENCGLKYNGTAWETFNVTVYNIGALELHVNSSVGGASGLNNALYLQRADKGALPVLSWSNDDVFVYESGDGFRVNGVQKTPSEIKSTGDGFYWGFDAVAANAVVTISGTFYCANQKIAYVIEQSAFKWTGSAWQKTVVYETYNIGKVVIGSGSSASAVYFDKANDEKFEVTEGTWTEKLTYESGIGITLNSTKINMNDIKIPNNLYVGLGTTAKAGDVLAIGGTFYNEKLAVKYVIEESKFTWNGTAWVEYVPPTAYTTFNVGTLKLSGEQNDAQNVYFKPVDGKSLPVNSWDYAFSYVSGNGITVNGTMINMENSVKSVGDSFFINLGAKASTGALLKIEGTFRCEATKHDYVIEESTFMWNGTAWEKYVEYTTYNIGAMTLSNLSATAGAHAKNTYFYLHGQIELPYEDTNWNYPFVVVDGYGLKINGEQANLIKAISSNSGFFVEFAGVQAGDVVSVCGTFANADQGIKYVIEESEFVWNGSAWEAYVEYTTYNIGKVVIGSGSSASAVYFDKASGDPFEVTEGTWTEKLTFAAGSGIGVTLNGTQIDMGDIKIPNNIYVNLGTTAKKDDVLKIGGTFYNANLTVKYVIEESTFTWSGIAWLSSALADCDTITIFDLGLGLEWNISGTKDQYVGLSYVASEANTTGSVKFRFGYNSADVTAGKLVFRLRGSDWAGLHYEIAEGVIRAMNTAWYSYALSANTDYVIEIGAIDLVDGTGILTYISVDGIVVTWEVLNKERSSAPYGDYKFGDFDTSHISIYAENIATTTLTDVDRVEITYTTEIDAVDYEEATFVEYVLKGQEYTLKTPKTYQYAIGWVDENDTFYKDGETIQVMEALSLSAIYLNFEMDEGASIRVADSADTSGIRFTTKLLADDYNYLLGLDGVKSVSYGTLIMPYDYLGAGQAPNLEEFAVGERILKIPCEKKEEIGDYIVYRGAMQKLYTANYERLFAGRGYIEITFTDDEVWTIYTPFEFDSNVRSIRSVAQDFKVDTSEPENGEIRYNTLSDTRKEIVDNYAASETINLMNYSKYKESTFLQSIAWYYPELDSSNAYNNATNIAIAQKMKATGITAVYLDGKYHLDLNTFVNIEKTRQIINFFWSQGLYTIAFGSNAAGNIHIDYTSREYPDFSDCEGFMGYLVWDEPEPKEDSFEKLAGFAQNFEQVYAGTGVTFMTNLLPSYASTFNGTTNWWESSLSSLDKTAYKDYLKAYCDTVLSQVKGEKWLSLDTYPINADKSLTANFLFDLAMLKYYANANSAHAHVALQSSGWTEDGNTTKNRMPTEAEMRMQAYAAMAFGIDSMSWWSYSDKREDNQSNPTDSDDYYTRFANVNKELAAIGHIYKAFEWKGVILGAGKDNGSKVGSIVISTDQDYEAFKAVKGQIGDYELSATATKHLASVSTNKTNWNYLMGVMEDANGNEGYVLCNYNSHEENRAQTITLTFDSNITEVVIYRGSDILKDVENYKPQTQTVNNKTLAISLATGEGVIVLPSKLG